MAAKVVDLRKGTKKAAPEIRPLPLSEGRPRRPSPLRTRRRRLRLAALGGFAVVLLLALYGVRALSYMPQFNIQTITITGAERTDIEAVKSFVSDELREDGFHVLSRSNIFIYPREILEKGIVATFPGIKTAYITRPDPLSNEIVVAIGERQLYAKWCSVDGSCYAMDDTGYVFAESSLLDVYATPYLFSGGIDEGPIGSVYMPELLDDVLTLLELLQSEAHLTPLTIEKSADPDFVIGFAEGFQLKASQSTAVADLARDLQLVLTSEVLRERLVELEYVDLRFGNRVYYKFEGEPVSE